MKIVGYMSIWPGWKPEDMGGAVTLWTDPTKPIGGGEYRVFRVEFDLPIEPRVEATIKASATQVENEAK